MAGAVKKSRREVNTMAKNRLSIIGFAIFILIGVSYFWWNTMSWTGELTSLRPHFDGSCEVIPGIIGAEDAVIDHETGLAFISSHDRRNRDSFGAIWVMPLDNAKAAKPLEIIGYDAPLFSPHGIDLWVGEDGVRRLFVVEHADWSQSRIVIFRLEEEKLVFERAITDTLIKRPNDVAAAGVDSFYTTNDLGAPYGARAEFFEVLFRQAKGNLVYYDGANTRIAAAKIAYANGVALSNDGTQLYLAATVDQSVRFYQRDLQNGELTLKDELVLRTGVDNIDVDPDGILWVAAHPKLLTFSKHAKDESVRAPSQIIRIDPGQKTLSEAYLSTGDPLSGAAIGAHANGRLIIGGVFDPRVLACTLPAANQ